MPIFVKMKIIFPRVFYLMATFKILYFCGVCLFVFTFINDIKGRDILENKVSALTRLSSVLSLTKPSSWSLTKERSLLPAVIIVTITSCRIASSGSCDLTFKYSVTMRNNEKFGFLHIYCNLLVITNWIHIFSHMTTMILFATGNSTETE